MKQQSVLETQRELFWGHPLPNELCIGWWCEQQTKTGRYVTKYDGNFLTIAEAKKALNEHLQKIGIIDDWAVVDSGFLFHLTDCDPEETQIRLTGIL